MKPTAEKTSWYLSVFAGAGTSWSWRNMLKLVRRKEAMLWLKVWCACQLVPQFAYTSWMVENDNRVLNFSCRHSQNGPARTNFLLCHIDSMSTWKPWQLFPATSHSVCLFTFLTTSSREIDRDPYGFSCRSMFVKKNPRRFFFVLWIDAFLAVIRRRSLDRPFLFRFPGPAGPPGRSIFSSLSQRLGPVSVSCSRSTAHDWWHTMVLVESIPKQT